jgi:hypothetical protein
VFKSGQKIIILKLYNLEHDGAGTYLHPSRDLSNKGKHLIRTEYGDLTIALGRLVDATEYWEGKRKERNEQA